MINSISSDPNGNPMFSASETTVVHFTGEEFSVFDPQTDFAEADRAVQWQNVRLHCNYAPDKFYGSCITDGRKLTFSPAEGLDENKLRAAARDADGNFWLVNDRQELVRVENGKVVRIYNEASGLPKIPLDFVTSSKINLVSWDGKDSLWLTDLETMRSELFFKIPDTQQESGDIYPPYAGGESVFQSAYQDGEGNFWFGSLRAGLFRARKQIVKAFSSAAGLTDNNVYPLFENDDGSIFVGTTSGVFNLNNGRFAPVESPKSVIHAFGKDSAGRIVFSSFGDLFVREANRSIPFFARENSLGSSG